MVQKKLIPLKLKKYIISKEEEALNILLERVKKEPTSVIKFEIENVSIPNSLGDGYEIEKNIKIEFKQ